MEVMQLPCSYLEEFDFNSGRTSPCGSSPSTPRGFGDQYFYFSAPTSPTPPLPPPISTVRGGVKGGYELYNDDLGSNCYTRGDLYATNTTSKSMLGAENTCENVDNNNNNNNMINNPSKKPLPNGIKHKSLETIKSPLLSPQSSNNLQNKKKFWSPFSPKRKKEPPQNNDEETNKTTTTTTTTNHQRIRRQRDREIGTRHVSRSLSPLRVSKYPWEEDEKRDSTQLEPVVSKHPTNTPTLSSSLYSSSSSSKGSKKWRLKDLLLFRSASEGRALDYNKDSSKKKFSYMQWKNNEVHNKSFNNSNNNKEVVGSVRNRRGGNNNISAHEIHYTVNKAISEEMKKKSFLPYKQGILGRLAFNPTVHALAHGFGSLAPP